jgi:hypothetical protein
MRRRVVVFLVSLLALPALCRAQGSAPAFHAIGDLPGGPAVSIVRDATRNGGMIYAVGASAANNQVLCVAPNNPIGCVPQFNPDTAVLWTWDGSAATLTPLPDLVTPATPPVNPLTAWAITPDAAFIASAARSSAANPAQSLAVRVMLNGLLNLNLSAPPFPTLNPPASAQAISSDGSILYGVAGNRAVRFDVNTTSSTLIPLLLGSHTGNNIAGRGTSADGSVAVGTSFVAPFSGTNGRAFRYLHGNPAGTVSAIPLLAGGTWNKAIAVSPDGVLVLTSGDSTFLPNGEMYLYDATTGITTPLGSPNTPWVPANAGGMTADGSVVAATFASPNPQRHAYIHNAHGWFHLTTAVAALGIDLAAAGWEAESMGVTGISADGTLVFGAGTRNGNPEGFVAEFAPGYLASFDVPAVAQTDTSIVGVWGGGGDAMVFLADGTYFQLDIRHGSQPAGEYTSGFERGRYHWDATTGALTFATLQDTNGSVGMSGANGFLGFTATVSGNTLDISNGAIVLTRVTGGLGSIVGGWVFGDPRIDDSSGVLALFADGTFIFAEDGNSAFDPSGHDGVEAGIYTWNPSGAFTFTLTLDTNGLWGFAGGAGGSGTITLLLSADELRLVEPGNPTQLTRIVDPQAVLPVITSPLAATGTVGSPFAYTITALHAESFAAMGMPPGLSLDTTTGLISGTPTAAGAFNVTIWAANSFNNTGTASLTITVLAPTTLAVANSSGLFGGTTTLVASLTIAGSPFAGQQVSFSLNGMPVGTAVTDAAGVALLSGVSLAGIGAGTYATGIQAAYAGDPTHAAATGSATLTIGTLIPVISWASPAAIAHGTPLGAAQLNATANVPGTLVYTPPPGTILPVGSGQTLSVTFTPTDTTNYTSALAQVAITVLNAAPVARGVVVTTQEGVAQSGTLLATDLESDPLTFSIVTPPAKGTLVLVDATTGAFTYTPDAGVTGYDSFEFRAQEGSGASSTAIGSVFIVAVSPQWPGQTVRASAATDGTGDHPIPLGAMSSADGRFIAFVAGTLDLSTGTGTANVFVYDRQTGATDLVSKSSTGQPIGGALPWLSPDGRYVTFTTIGSTLPGGDPNAPFEAIVHDRQTGETTRANVSSSGTPANGGTGLSVVSADGRYVAFTGTTTNLVPGDTDIFEDVYIHDRQTGRTGLVSVSSTGQKGNSNSWRPTISADGRFIAFNSESTNLVPNDTNGAIDVFVRDLRTGQTTRVSVASGGGQSNGDALGFLSADGRYVMFASAASNLVAGDTNGVKDVFVHDRQTGQTTLVSVSSTGALGNADSEEGTLSADGRFVAFRSLASNLVPGDTNGLPDDFVHDRMTGKTVRVNVASDGSEANAASIGDEDGCCIAPAISADGRSIVITSLATNLVAGDTNNADDVFVVGPIQVNPTAVSVSGSAGTHSVNVSADYPGPWTATTTTPWITINPPAGGSGSGPASFIVAANPGAARTGTIVVALQTVTVDQGPSTAPIAQSGSFTTAEDTPLSGTLVASDPNGDPISYSLVSQPARGTVVITDPSTGAFTYTPSLSVFGGDSFTFQAIAAGETSNIATVSITITPVNDPPSAFDSTLSVIEDTPANSFFSTADADSLFTTVAIVTPPAHGVVTIPNPRGGALGGVAYTYTPNANYNGPDIFTFQAMEGTLLSNIATVSVSVAPANDAPVANSTVVTTQQGAPQTGVLQASDIDGDPLSFSIVTAPTKGTIVVNDPTTGAFTFTPNAGAIGYDTFTFRATDSSNVSSTATGMAFIVAASPRWPGQTVRANPPGNFGPGVGETIEPVPSADGRYVAFSAAASNLIAGDTNGATDVFVFDRLASHITRESVASNGAQANNSSFRPAISADGRYVAFYSFATNLVSGDANGTIGDIFVHDRQTGTTTRVNVSSTGVQGNGESSRPTLSGDGRYVAFYSDSSNLVAGDTNNSGDLFVHDRQTGQTTRESVASNGQQGTFGGGFESALSADGRYVAFSSNAPNLVASDTNATSDVFVRDRQTGQTTRVSTASTGAQGNARSYSPAITADGRYVAFVSDASNFAAGDTNNGPDVFIHDRQTGSTLRIGLAPGGVQADGFSSSSSLSADGRYVTFISTSTNLVSNDTNGVPDAFVYDQQTGATVRVSVSSGGIQADRFNYISSLSADGQFVALSSLASNLAGTDTNNHNDVFIVGGVSVSPTAVTAPVAGGSLSVNVQFTYPGTAWAATTATPWITINPPAGGSANGTVSFTVAPNFGPARTDTLDVALHTVTVTQAGFADVTPPTVTPPAPITVYATLPTGATQALLPALSQFLLGATAVDNASAPPVQQAPQLNGAVIVPTTVFTLGANTVTFSFTDAAGNLGTATSVVTVVGGAPSLSVALVGTIAAQGAQNATLRITNNGTGNALSLAIALASLRTLAGTGNVTLVSGLPATVPLLGPAQSYDIPIVLNVPSTVRRFAVSEALTTTDYTGALRSTTATQTVFPIDVTPPTLLNNGPTIVPARVSATLTWQTSEPATRAVAYGFGTSTNNVIPDNGVYATSHTVTITGLVPNTTYSVIVSGHDPAGNTYVSIRKTFRTNP